MFIFTSHIVKVKPEMVQYISYWLERFTSHIVKVKPLRGKDGWQPWMNFTSHIVKVKPVAQFLIIEKLLNQLYIPHS